MKIAELHGYPQIEPKYARLLLSCISQKETRYAINCVEVSKKTICAIDGKRLLVIYCKHKIDPGLYYLSKEFMLLKNDPDKKFPNWESIIRKDTKEIKIGGFYSGTTKISRLMYRINNTGHHIDFDLYEPVARRIAILGVSDMILEIPKKSIGDRPIQLRFKKYGDTFLFVLMSLSL